MISNVKQKPSCLVPKYPSDTQWSTRADATEAVVRGFKQFQSALQEIATNDNQTGDTRNQANAFAKQMNSKEVAFICELCNDILQRFNKRSILLQSSSIELTTTASLMKSLDQFVTECREKFDSYDVKAFDGSGNKFYKFESESRRTPKRKKYFSDGSAVDTLQGMSGVSKFTVSIFYVIVDQLNNALKQRIKSYLFVQQRFGVLTEFDSMSDEDIKIAIKKLVDIYLKTFLSNSTQNSVSLFTSTRNSQKNTAEKSQQALLNIFSKCCIQWSLDCIH